MMEEPAPTYLPTSAATVGSSRYGFNMNYLKSPLCIFRIVEVILGIIVCSCVGGAVCLSSGCFTVSFAPGSGYEGQGFVIFVGVICILANLLFIVLNLLSLVDQPGGGLKVVEFIYTGIAAILYFIAAIVEAAYAGGMKGVFRSNWIAAAVTTTTLKKLYQKDVKVFAWFNLALYGVDTFFNFQRTRRQ